MQFMVVLDIHPIGGEDCIQINMTCGLIYFISKHSKKRKDNKFYEQPTFSLIKLRATFSISLMPVVIPMWIENIASNETIT